MNNNNNFKDFFKENGFSVAIFSTVVVLLIATLYFSYSGFESQNENIVKNEDKNNFEAVNKSNVKSYKESTTIKEETEITTKSITQNITEKPVESTTNLKKSENTEDKKEKVESTTSSPEAKAFDNFDENKEMTWPVFGQIVMDFSTETAIYNKTLDQYRTNNSIAISAPEGTDIMASYDGVVNNIFNDNENGNTVVLDHGNGWMSTYSQLNENLNVTVGQVVKEGEFIGKVGTPSNYSVLLGPHLNFQIAKDNIYKDPKLILSQIEE